MNSDNSALPILMLNPNDIEMVAIVAIVKVDIYSYRHSWKIIWCYISDIC